MIYAFSPFLALRYLVRRPIMLIGVFGVTFAVWALLVVDGVFTGFVTDIQADVRRSTADLIVTDLPHDTGFLLLQATIEADAAVRATAPRLRHYGLLQPRRGPGGGTSTSAVNFENMTMESGFASLLGIDPLLEPEVAGLRAWLARSEDVLAAHGVAIPASRVLEEPSQKRRSYLRVPDHIEWQARGRLSLDRPRNMADYHSQWPGLLIGWRRLPYMQLREGDPIDLLTSYFHISADGTAKVRTSRIPLAYAGCFATSHRQFDQNTVILPIETLRTQLGHDIASDGSIDLITDVAIRLRDGLAKGEIEAAKVRLQLAVQALLPKDSTACSVIDWQEQNSVFLRAIAQEHSMMQFVLFVVMVVAGFVIYAVLHMMVVQKWKDIGILASLGGTPRGIGTVFVFCGLIVGGTGALLGAIAGTLSVHYLNAVNNWARDTFGQSLFPDHLFDLRVIPVHLETTFVVQVALGALLLSLIVAILPARKAARMEPVTALAYE